MPPLWKPPLWLRRNEPPPQGRAGAVGEGQEGEVRPMPLKVAKPPFEMIVIDPRSR